MIGKAKIRAAVLMGGPSAEHDISLKSGRMVMKFLDRKKYEPAAIVISKKGKWPVKPAALKKKFDVVFIAMHGEYGEDGTVQKILDQEKVFYTGSASKASRLGMDKLKSEALFRKAGLNVPGAPRGFPLVIKPVDRGSSLGVSMVNSPKDFIGAVKSALRYSSRIMMQEYIPGRELTCGVLEVSGKPISLPPTEIIPRKKKFFDFDAKYKKGVSREITPPHLPPPVIKKIQAAAVKAHQAIGARGFSRTDMVLENSKSKFKNQKLYVLEINTIPGLTERSLLPQQAKAAGINFSRLLDLIIEASL
jgi:D-alanine-D-alanine ligase